MSDLKHIVMIGAGGHASVLADLITLRGYTLKGYITSENEPIQYRPNEIYLVNGVGAVSPEGNQKRAALFESYKKQGYEFLTLIHPSAIVSSSAKIGEGAQIMAGVVVQANAEIGTNSIINTRASIDHDCKIGHSVHVAPGSVLSGNVTLEDHVMVGVGATIIQGISVREKSFILAGQVIRKRE